MDLRQLAYFVAVGEAGGFRRAAEKMFITQPALSRQIRLLEEELGVALLEREARGSILTDAGRFFLQEAREIQERVAQTEERVKRIGRGQSGVLRMAVSESGAVNSRFADMVRCFNQQYPDVELVMSGHDSISQVNALVKGAIDVGFLHGVPVDDANFEHFEVHSHRVQVAMPQNHPLAQRERLLLRDLAAEPMIWPPRSTNYKFYDELMQEFQARGVQPRIVQQISPGSTMLSLVRAGLGLGILLSEMTWQSPPGVIRRFIDDISMEFRIDLVWRRDNGSPVLRKFVEVARARAQSPDIQSKES